MVSGNVSLIFLKVRKLGEKERRASSQGTGRMDWNERSGEKRSGEDRKSKEIIRSTLMHPNLHFPFSPLFANNSALEEYDINAKLNNRIK
jgi:hypothetical protein